jgi:large subunit GTPase 1
MSRKNKNSGLGRQLIKTQHKERKQKPEANVLKHTTDTEAARESILDQKDLDSIIAHAELSGKKFIAEKQNVVIISKNVIEVDEIDSKRMEEMEKHWNEITIPKRPNWDENTTTEELKQLENESFLEWRRGLAELEKNEHLLLTPFEKNLEVWRQLWRVVERSTLVVQIVDARNPLLFRCVDLEKWVLSLGKGTLLLVNKADYLTSQQRNIWADFFESEGIPFVFFSALTSTEEQSDNDNPRIKIFSREELLKLFIEECKKISNTRTEDRYMVGMVGYPNVGKSSTINFLMEQKKSISF